MGLVQDVLSSFFPDKTDKSAKKQEQRANIEPNTDDVISYETVKRSGKLTQVAHHKRLYGKQPSFVDHLPWGEYLAQEGVMLLDDGRSVGVVFDLKPIGTEGRSEEYLSRIRGLVKDAIQDSFDELDTYPYVVQFYCQDEKDLRSYVEQLKDYIAPEIQATAFTQEWLKNTEKHLKDISKPGGLFVDDQITNTIWAGRIRRTRMVIYRYVEKNEEHSAIESLNNACERIVGALTTAGLQLIRQNGEQLHQWLLRWFNPNPSAYFNLENSVCYDKLHQPITDGELPFSVMILVKICFITNRKVKIITGILTAYRTKWLWSIIYVIIQQSGILPAKSNGGKTLMLCLIYCQNPRLWQRLSLSIRKIN